MNFEQHFSAPEKLALPSELVDMAEKGIIDAEKTAQTFERIAEAMVIDKSSVSEKDAYLAILRTISELKSHADALKNHLN